MLQESQLLELRLERDQAAARACRLQLRMECILGQAGAADETVAATLAGAAAAGAGTEASYATAAQKQPPRGKAAGWQLCCTCLLGLGSRPDMSSEVHSAWFSGKSRPFPNTMPSRYTGRRLACTLYLGLYTSCWPLISPERGTTATLVVRHANLLALAASHSTDGGQSITPDLLLQQLA